MEHFFRVQHDRFIFDLYALNVQRPVLIPVLQELASSWFSHLNNSSRLLAGRKYAMQVQPGCWHHSFQHLPELAYVGLSGTQLQAGW